ncbi:MAG: PorP/SprF family type IX secretion system membrane protein [Chitinophagales bacterium]
MKKLIVVIIIFTFGSELLKAQDVHFSQFFNVPVFFNPAMTGNFDGSFRATAIYRNQWPGPINGRTSFSTPGLSADAPIRLKNSDMIGVGAYFVNDRSAGANLKRVNFMASVAYHKVIAKNHALSFGLQGGYLQYSLQDIKFGDQYDELNNFVGGGADQGLAGNAANFDLNIGIAWNSRLSEDLRFSFGVAAFHILEPEISFSDQSRAGNVPRRYNANLSFDWRLNDKISLLPAYLYMHQAKASQHNFGLASAINLKEKTELLLGAFYRVKDAVIPYVGLQYHSFKLGLSYDVNASTLNATNGAAELSLTYTAPYVPVPEVDPSLYCPRF